MLRAVRRGCEARGGHFVWYARTPRRALVPRYWQWSIWLGAAVALAPLILRHVAHGPYLEWPARLDYAAGGVVPPTGALGSAVAGVVAATTGTTVVASVAGAGATTEAVDAGAGVVTPVAAST